MTAIVNMMNGKIAFTATPATRTPSLVSGDFPARLSWASGFSSPSSLTNPPNGNQFIDQSISLSTTRSGYISRILPVTVRTVGADL